jgi:hypothetical protein
MALHKITEFDTKLFSGYPIIIFQFSIRHSGLLRLETVLFSVFQALSILFTCNQYCLYL